MRLRTRLAALASLVPEGSVVADIGTDHAFLPIFLVQEGLARKVIAVENRLSTLNRARQSLNLFNHNYKIELRLGDGLKPLRREDGVEIVVIAGLGGRAICRMLLASREKWDWFQMLILQPMQETPLLRRWLVAHGMRLVSERLVREGAKIYEIMAVGRGRQAVADPLLFELGPCLVRERDPLLAALIKQKIGRCRAIAAALQSSGRRESKFKQAYFREKEARLTEVLALVGDSGDHR
jgi:tRNA (adenine22-N1)-methyltransferase